MEKIEDVDGFVFCIGFKPIADDPEKPRLHHVDMCVPALDEWQYYRDRPHLYEPCLTGNP